MLNCKIISHRKLTSDCRLMEISLPNAKKCQPGQFVMLSVGNETTDPLLKIPLAIHDVSPNSITVLYQILGKKTNLLSTKKSNEIINILGPLGNGFKIKENISHAILVAGGIGIAPLYLLAKQLNANKITLFLGIRQKENLLRIKEFSDLGVDCVLATDDGSLGFKGNVVDLFRKNFPELNNNSYLFASGPEPMLKSLSLIVNTYKIPAQFSFEAYMACGIGACRGCTVVTDEGYKLCCQDGPVFLMNNL